MAVLACRSCWRGPAPPNAWAPYISTGEGGYPEELEPYAAHIITQVATGLFGVSRGQPQRAPLIEIKYAQGAKPGLGGHLLGNKNTDIRALLARGGGRHLPVFAFPLP